MSFRMSGGEIFVFVFVTFIFCLGIYFGIKLFKMNQRQRKRLEERNVKARAIRAKQNETANS